MNPSATILAWLALVVGFPQVLIGMLAFYAAGWWLAGALGLVLLPFAPMIVRMHPRFAGRAAPAVVALACLSLMLSVAVYWTVLREFALD